MGLNVHFLGTGGWFPSDRRQTSCVMIPEIGVIFDAGTGFYRVRENIKTPWLDLFLSHLHDDHICGWLYLLGQLRETSVKEVDVYGRKGIGKFLACRQFCNPRFPLSIAQHEELTKIPFWTSDELFRHKTWRPRYEPYQVSGDHWLDYSYETFPSTRLNWSAELVNTPHPSGGSLAIILQISEIKEQAKEVPCWRLAYVIDTTVDLKSKRIKRLAKVLQREKELDLLILECNFANRHEELARASGHSWPAVAIDFIKEVNPRCVALTHHHALADAHGSGFMWEDVVAWEEVRKEIPHAILAEDKQIISL